jgi:hypothetical protein
MALYINYKDEWHVGEPVPKNLGRVVTFQADGNELELILDAMDGKTTINIEANRDEVISNLEMRLELVLAELALEKLAPKVVYGELARPSNN